MDTRPIFSQCAYQACNGDMAKVNEYTVQRKIYDNYIKHKYDTNKIEELSEKYVYHDEFRLDTIWNIYLIYTVFARKNRISQTDINTIM